MDATSRALNIADLRAGARARLPRGMFDYVDRGVEDEAGLAANRAAFDRVHLAPRILRDVSRIALGTTLLGRPLPMPFAVAPTGGAGLVWHGGDLHLARAAAARGVPFTVSSASTMDVEEIAVAGGSLWFQLYLWEDRALSHAALRRARDVGCDVLFVTVDLPVGPNREYNERNGFGLPLRMGARNALDVLAHPRWLAGVLGRYMLGEGMPRQANLPPELRGKVTRSAPIGAGFRQDNLEWDEVARLRDHWPGPILLKGVSRADDAARALALGIDGVVVSNHGGRSLDASIPSIAALPPIVAEVGGRLAVLVDGSITRGTQVVKALALGADLVLVGRAPLYGLAVAGEAGAGRALDLLAAETARVMAQVGSRTVAEITPDLIATA